MGMCWPHPQTTRRRTQNHQQPLRRELLVEFRSGRKEPAGGTGGRGLSQLPCPDLSGMGSREGAPRGAGAAVGSDTRLAALCQSPVHRRPWGSEPGWREGHRGCDTVVDTSWSWADAGLSVPEPRVWKWLGALGISLPGGRKSAQLSYHWEGSPQVTRGESGQAPM